MLRHGPVFPGRINGFYQGMYGSRGPWPDETFDGCYVNYCDSDLVDWQYLYYKENYPRPQRAKAQWDPHNVFHHGQSVELPWRTSGRR